MIDHVIVPVTDIAASKVFYERALRPLDYELLLEFPGNAGFGVAGKPDFWIREKPTTEPAHIAFRVDDRSLVDAFHEAAVAAGGTDNGAPGLRELYHPSYYGAFVLDPDGHNVEAVCHERATED